MKKNLLKLLLVSSYLTCTTFAAENHQNYSSLPDLDDSLVERLTHSSSKAFSSTIDDIKESVTDAYHFLKGNLPSKESVEIKLINYIEDAIRKNFVNAYFIKEEKDELNTEALLKLIDPIYKKVSLKLKTSMFSTEYIAVSNTGEELPVITNKKVISTFLEKIIPDFPFKTLLVGISNVDIVDKWLENKIKEQVINLSLNMYKNYCGTTLKEDLGQNLLTLTNTTFKKSVDISKSVLEDYDDCKNLPDLYETKLTDDETKILSNLFKFIRPHVNYHIRQILETDYINAIASKVLKESSNKLITSMLRMENVSNLTNSLTLLGPLFTTSLFDSAYRLPLGVASAMFSYGSGVFIGKFASNMQSDLLNYSDNLINMYKKYLSHALIPITQEEYCLYNLPETRSDELSVLLHEDYKFLNKLQSQTLLQELIKDLNNIVGKETFIAKMLTSAGDKVVELVRYLKSSPELCSFSINEESNITTLDSYSRDSIHNAKRYINTLYSKKELTAKEKKLLAEVNKYPSYEEYMRYMDKLNKKMHYLSKSDLSKLTQEKALEEENNRKLLKTYEDELDIIESAAHTFAHIYEKCNKDVFAFPLHIFENIQNQASNLSGVQLNLLKDAVKNEIYLEAYVSKNSDLNANSYLVNLLCDFKRQNLTDEAKEELSKFDKNSISEGLTFEEKIKLLKKGIVKNISEVDVEKLKKEDKEAFKNLFNRVVAHQIAVVLKENFEESYKETIKKIIISYKKEYQYDSDKDLLKKVTDNDAYKTFKEIIEKWDDLYPVEIGKKYTYIKNASYNEMHNFIKSTLNELDLESSKIETPKKNLLISYFMNTSAGDKNKAPQSLESDDNSGVSKISHMPTQLSITELVSYDFPDEDARDSRVLAAFINSHLQGKDILKYNTTNLIKELIDTLYKKLESTRVGSFSAIEDVDFSNLYLGEILQKAKEKNKGLFYTHSSLIEELRKDAKKIIDNILKN